EAGRGREARPLAEIFRPPLLGRTLLGILLGTVPLLGTWSSGKWLIPWADAEAEGEGAAVTQAVWAAGAVLGSAGRGWLRGVRGRLRPGRRGDGLGVRPGNGGDPAGTGHQQQHAARLSRLRLSTRKTPHPRPLSPPGRGEKVWSECDDPAHGWPHRSRTAGQ